MLCPDVIMTISTPKCYYWEHQWCCPTWEILNLWISAPFSSVIWYEECCFLATSHFRSFAISAWKMDVVYHYKDISPLQNSNKTLLEEWENIPVRLHLLGLKIQKRKDLTSRTVFSNLFEQTFQNTRFFWRAIKRKSHWFTSPWSHLYLDLHHIIQLLSPDQAIHEQQTGGERCID